MSAIKVGPTRPLYEKTYGEFAVTTYLLTQHRVIVYAMSGYIMPEDVHAYLDDLLACARKERPVAMIADPRRMKVLNKDAQHAIQHRFWPEIARMGIKKNPALVPAAAITAQSVHRMVRSAGEIIDVGDGKSVEIAVFASLEDCLDFIFTPGP